jgi:hypothetical protein
MPAFRRGAVVGDVATQRKQEFLSAILGSESVGSKNTPICHLGKSFLLGAGSREHRPIGGS